MNSSSFLSLIVRLYWLIVAPAFIIYFSLIRIIVNNEKSVKVSIVGTSILLASTIIVRYIDIRFFNGTTSEGEKATIKDWYNYTKLSFLIVPPGTALLLLVKNYIL
ncbi:MAG: hypothetical protein JNL74_08145 [Fibrobacteres bacterium]|nr:hypothetical protein [Fibrobacterota bacterium]